MGKRSDFRRRPQDAYDTPPEVVMPLLDADMRFLSPYFTFIEPCAGRGALMDTLEANGGECLWAYDIEPRAERVGRIDALKLRVSHRADYIITNPPWTRQILEPMITHFRQMMATWLLLPADFAHTKYAAAHLKYCSKIVTVGRVRWIPDSPHTSKDSAAWYLFGRDEVPTVFHGRAA